MDLSDRSLSKDDIERLLTRLGELAASEGIRIEMFIVGGAAMALAYNASRSTGDLDAVFEPKAKVYDLARRIAGEEGPALSEDWLNDSVKAFLPGHDPDARGVLKDCPGLAVTVASPRYLFVLKAMAARESDEDDLRALYPMCGFAGVQEALDVVERSYPLLPIKPNVEYLVRCIGEECERLRAPHGVASPENERDGKIVTGHSGGGGDQPS